MFVRVFFVAGIASLAVAYFSDSLTRLEQSGSDTPVADSHAAVAQPVSAAARGIQVIKAGPGGHFGATFQLNGKAVPAVVDTGATYVAINETTARRIGFNAGTLAYDYDVSTANGTTKAAHVTIERIEIGPVRVRQVEAFVLKDKALSSTLIGMSFLKELRSYSVAGGALQLAN